MTPADRLLSRWTDLVPHPGADIAGRALLARWAEPHRRYHDLTHLDQVLRCVDELAADAADADAVRLAVFFHDAVYDIGAPDNERRSAALAHRCLSDLGVAASQVAEVARLVRLTAAHAPGEDDANGAVLCDADLSILGAAPAAYAAYTARVRDEYRVVPDDAFRHGRSEVLRSLLARSPRYLTAAGRERWEAAAQRNVSTELALLDAAG